MENNTHLHIEYVPIDSLRPAEYNPRKATRKEYDDLKASIERFGLIDPLIVNRHPGRENVIIGGHFRYRMARDLGTFKELPCIFVDVDEQKEKELNLRLNKNTAQFDKDMLSLFDETMLQDVGFQKIEYLGSLGGMDDTMQQDQPPSSGCKHCKEHCPETND